MGWGRTGAGREQRERTVAVALEALRTAGGHRRGLAAQLAREHDGVPRSRQRAVNEARERYEAEQGESLPQGHRDRLCGRCAALPAHLFPGLLRALVPAPRSRRPRHQGAATQPAGSYWNARTSCAHRQATAIFAAHSSAASREGNSSTA